MADGYLEKRMEEFASGAKKTVKHVSLDTLFEKNRSHRGYKKDFVVTGDMLKRIVNVNTKIASGKNQQVLRFKLVTKGVDANFVLQNIKPFIAKYLDIYIVIRQMSNNHSLF